MADKCEHVWNLMTRRCELCDVPRSSVTDGETRSPLRSPWEGGLEVGGAAYVNLYEDGKPVWKRGRVEVMSEPGAGGHRENYYGVTIDGEKHAVHWTHIRSLAQCERMSRRGTG